MTEVKKTPCWMESGRKTESGVPEVLMDGRRYGTRRNRLRFARKMAERKQRKKQLEEEAELQAWRKQKQQYKDKGIALVKRPPMSKIQEQYGARRVG